MGVSTRHILQQGPVLAALGRTALSALQQQLGKANGHGQANGSEAVAAVCPGPVIERTFAPLPAALLDDFVKFLGGDPRAYRGEVPAHLFPQWSFPVAAGTLSGLPYPLLKVVNGGCRMERRGPIPRGRPLSVRAQLTHIDDDGRRVVLTERVTTGTAEDPELLVAEIHAYVPLPRKAGVAAGDGSAKKSKPTVPAHARELGRLRLRRDAGLSFAKLTGDFNPIHWVPAYAKASGFRQVILHGFGTFAFAAEMLVSNLLGGDQSQLAVMEARFTRPLVLPKDVGVYVDGPNIYVGAAPAGPAYMTGTFATKEAQHV